MVEEVPSSTRTKLDDDALVNSVQQIQIAEEIGGNLFETSCLTNAINRKLFLDETTADVHFLFEEREEVDAIISVPAHKLILSTGSKVFHTMFYGSLPADNGNVEIVDATAAAFKEFLQFFYCDKVTLTSENVAKVMYLVEKYGIERCMKQCIDFLKNTTTNDDVCSVLQLALQYDLEDLKHFCERKICGYAEDVLQSDEFMNCKSDIFNCIIRLDSLMCEDVKVFDACIEWAKKSCEKHGVNKEVENLREQLKDSLYFIHFRRMKIEEFAPRNAEYFGLFTLMEVKDIMLIIASKEYQCELFTTNPVSYDILKWDENSSFDVVFEKYEEYGTLEVERKESLQFSCKNPLLLGKLKFAQIFANSKNINLRHSTTIKMRIIEKSKKETTETTLFDQMFHLRNEKDVFAEFGKPIFIHPKCTYEFQFDCENAKFDVNYSRNGKQTYGDLEITVLNSRRLIDVMYFNKL